MRNLVVAGDVAAQLAGTEAFAAGGNAADAIVAALLAGAVRASPATLLGSAVIALAGPGAGSHYVDGRARIAGLGERRQPAPVTPPEAHRAAVPGLLEGALTAHNRFGSLGLGTVVRIAARAVLEHEADAGVRARVDFLESLPRLGIDALVRLGISSAMLAVAGPLTKGVLSRDDLRAQPAPVSPLMLVDADAHDVLLAPVEAPAPVGLPSLPATPVGGAVCADMHGVVAAVVWVIAPEAAPLATGHGLSLAALTTAPTKGIPRRRAGVRVPMPTPFALLRHEGRAWAALAVEGDGDLETARDAFLEARLKSVGITYEIPARGDDHPGAMALGAARGQRLWVVRADGDEVQGTAETIGG